MKGNREHKLFMRLADASGQALGIANLDGSIIYANNSLTKILGFEHFDDISGKSIEQFYTPEDLEYLRTEVLPTVMTEGQWSGELQLKAHDGTLTSTLHDVVSLSDNEGVPAYLANVITDITGRKQIEEALRESEANLERAQHIAKMGDFTWSIKTGKVTWSKGMYHLLKYDVDNEIDLEKVNADIHHPEDLEKVTKWLTESIKSGIDKLVPCEYRLVCQNGEIIYVQTNGRIEYENNVAIMLYGTCTDISERKNTDNMLKESEERYRVLFDSSPDGILVADKVSRKFLYANPTICHLLGYSESELTNMGVLDIHPKKAFDYVLSEFELQASGKKLLAENIPCHPCPRELSNP